jgi:Beta-ketoacyl synthase, N-terminal domain
MTRHDESESDPVAVTGLGHVVVGPGDAPCDPMPYLRVKKLRKYMGVQDDLAVVAAAKALESAGLLARSASEGLGERTGLYLAVGYIPFERADLDPLLAASLDADGNFSMEAFSTAGFRTVNGLLTFRCLPNMPAFHVSTNFVIQGPYFVTYPGPGQFYVALEEALTALEEGSIDRALVGGVAHQRNFLVESHFARVEPPIPAQRLLDAAGCLVLERTSAAAARGIPARARLEESHVRYASFHPFEPVWHLEEIFAGSEAPQDPDTWKRLDPPGEMGPASLAVMLSVSAVRRMELRNWSVSPDGLFGESAWRLA